ncbi:hypothetical protein MMC06_003423 [Schaereria dolodes]|nr:hypothetical protein [Schaereria dolodes]
MGSHAISIGIPSGMNSMDEELTSRSRSSFASMEWVATPSMSPASQCRSSESSLDWTHYELGAPSVPPQLSLSPTTPSYDRSFPFFNSASFQHRPVNSIVARDATIFSDYGNLDVVDDAFVTESMPDQFCEKIHSDWESARFSDGLFPPYRNQPFTFDEAFVHPTEPLPAEAGLEYPPSAFEVGSNQGMYDLLDLTPGSRVQTVPQDVILSQPVSQPMTPQTRLGEPFQSPVKIEPHWPNAIREFDGTSRTPSPARNFLAIAKQPKVVRKNPNNRVSNRRSSHQSERIKKTIGVKRLITTRDGIICDVISTPKPNKCPWKDSKTGACCKEKFLRPEHLKRHFRTIHDQEKPFTCPQCQTEFGRNDNRKAHYKTHLPEELGGNKVTPGKRNLKKHDNKPISAEEAARLGMIDFNDKKVKLPEEDIARLKKIRAREAAKLGLVEPDNKNGNVKTLKGNGRGTMRTK